MSHGKLRYIILIILSGLFTNVFAQVNPFLPETFKDFPNVRDIAISKDGSFVLFTVESFDKHLSAIAFTRYKNNAWTAPELMPFSGKYKDLEPFIAPDGKRIYFASNRPLSDSGSVKTDFDIWWVDVTDIGLLSTPVNAGNIINTDQDEFYPSVSNNGNLYYTAAYDEANTKEDIYLSEYKNGTFIAPVKLPESINSTFYEFNAWISPDENLIVFSSFGRAGACGGGDLYYAKKISGVWQPAIMLPCNDINSAQLDYCPFIFDKYLYFTSTRQGKKEMPGFYKLNDFLQYIKTPANGLSRIYITEWRN